MRLCHFLRFRQEAARQTILSLLAQHADVAEPMKRFVMVGATVTNAA
jgi:hypothetical protein